MHRFCIVVSVFVLFTAVGSAASFAGDPVQGQQDAAVSVVVFCDFQGPFCKRFMQGAFPKIVENYVKTGKAKVVWKDFPLTRLHPWSDEAAAAMECVYRMGRDTVFWNVTGQVYEHQEALNKSNVQSRIVDWAAEKDVSASTVRYCLQNDNPMQEVDEDKQEGKNNNVSATPTVFINDRRIVGAEPYSKFKSVIESELVNGGSYPPQDSLESDNSGDKNDPMLGQKDAPVKIVEFCNFEGPFCQKIEQNTIPKIVSNYVETGKAKLVWKDFTFSNMHPWSKEAAATMECVYREGGNKPFWAVKKKIFDRQSTITQGNVGAKIKQWAAEEGVSEAAVQSCLDTGNPRQEVRADKQEAQNLSVSGTPTLFINEEKIVGAQPYSKFKSVIEDELEDGGSYPPQEGSDTGDGGSGGAPVGEQHEIELDPGWNMISVPFATEVSALTDDCTLRPYQQYRVWTYNGEEWQHPSTLQNERGYYVYSTDGCTATVTGNPDIISGIQLNKGWNMISSSKSLDEIKGTCSFHPYQGNIIWRLADGEWRHPDTLTSTGGYFVYAQQQCSLGIPAPSTPSE